MDFSFTEEQETVGKVARQLFEHRATPERLTELESGEVRFDQRCGANWLPRTCSASRCPNPSAAAAAAFSNSACCSPRWGGVLRRSPSTRPWCSARTPLPATVTRHMQQRYLREGGGRQYDLDRRARRTGQLRPDRAAHHCTRRRDTWRPGRQQGALVPAAQLADAIVVSAQADEARACSSSRRQPTASPSRPRAPPTVSPTPTSNLPARSGTGSTRPSARTRSARSTPGRSSVCARCRSAWPNAR